MTIPANPLECLVNLAQSVRLRFFWSTNLKACTQKRWLSSQATLSKVADHTGFRVLRDARADPVVG